MERYAEATGYPSPFPEWAAGFWQCKLRYVTQDELLNVAREYRKRDLPLSVIVSDFFHWTKMGEWKFDPAEWPDPDAMMKELERMGVQLMVSIWPTVNPASENYQHMAFHGMLVRNERGIPAHIRIRDKDRGEFMFGPDILVAPVLYHGARARKVYLPAGASWRNAWTDERHDGGAEIEAEAPLERIPIYVRNDCKLPFATA